MSDNNLLTCPFCGGEAEIGSVEEYIETHYFVNCVECLASTNVLVNSHMTTKEEAIELWNTRKGINNERISFEYFN